MKEDGLHTEYHANRQKKLEGRLVNGEREGVWIEWYESGKIWSEGNYKNGTLISSEPL